MIVSIHAPARGATGGWSRPWRRRPCFNSRAREGRDRGNSADGLRDFPVSIHAPARGATEALTRASINTRFQFTRPRGARPTSFPRVIRRFHRFNSRAREGRDTLSRRVASGESLFQFTRPRGARPRHGFVPGCCECVSIHAPARGATFVRQQVDVYANVSIHAPARGATRAGILAEELPAVSIHAPARGATCPSRRLRGCRAFQFTRPRGARRAIRYDKDQLVMVSIHAPARGATSIMLNISPVKPFQFTRPRGARPVPVRRRRRRSYVSIHAPARGATLSTCP